MRLEAAFVRFDDGPPISAALDATSTSKLMVTRSLDCGTTWSKPTVASDHKHTNQGVSMAIDPSTGAVGNWTQSGIVNDALTPAVGEITHDLVDPRQQLYVGGGRGGVSGHFGNAHVVEHVFAIAELDGLACLRIPDFYLARLTSLWQHARVLAGWQHRAH